MTECVQNYFNFNSENFLNAIQSSTIWFFCFCNLEAWDSTFNEYIFRARIFISSKSSWVCAELIHFVGLVNKSTGFIFFFQCYTIKVTNPSEKEKKNNIFVFKMANTMHWTHSVLRYIHMIYLKEDKAYYDTRTITLDIEKISQSQP